MIDNELMINLYEVFLAGYRAGLSGEENPAAAFAEYLSALAADNSGYTQ